MVMGHGILSGQHLHDNEVVLRVEGGQAIIQPSYIPGDDWLCFNFP